MTQIMFCNRQSSRLHILMIKGLILIGEKLYLLITKMTGKRSKPYDTMILIDKVVVHIPYII